MRTLLIAALAFATSPAFAQNAPTYLNSAGSPRESQGVVCITPAGVMESCANGSSPSSLTSVATTAAASSLTLKVGSGLFYQFQITTAATPGYVMVFDSATAPSDGAVQPAACWVVGANSSLSMSNTPLPTRFTNGLVLVFSSTGCFTLTKSATAFISGSVQ